MYWNQKQARAEKFIGSEALITQWGVNEFIVKLLVQKAARCCHLIRSY